MAKSASKSQSQKFKDLAREIGADEDEKAFEDKLRRIARQKPDKASDTGKPSGEKAGQQKKR
jgi:hypothetical protein